MKQLILYNTFSSKYVQFHLSQVHDLRMHNCIKPWPTAIVGDCISFQLHVIVCVFFNPSVLQKIPNTSVSGVYAASF